MTYGKGSLDGPPLPFHLHLTVSIYKNKRTPEYPPPTRELAPWHLFISACMLLSLHPENGKSSLVQKPHSMFFSCSSFLVGLYGYSRKLWNMLMDVRLAGRFPEPTRVHPKLCLHQGQLLFLLGHRKATSTPGWAGVGR